MSFVKQVKYMDGQDFLFQYVMDDVIKLYKTQNYVNFGKYQTLKDLKY